MNVKYFIHPVARFNYIPRIIGCLFTLAILGSLFYKNKFSFLWVSLIFHGLLWPHLAYYRVRKSRDSKKAEFENLLIDSFIIGVWTNVTSYSLWPVMALNLAILLDNITTGGLTFCIKGILSTALGILVSILVLGIEIRPEASLATNLLSASCIFFFICTVGYISNDIKLKYIKAKKSLKQHQNHLEELISERTRELETAKIAAEDANNAKTAFLMNMTHELRTPLNGVLGSAEMITEDESMDEILTLRDMICSSSYSLLNTIEKILDFTKLNDEKFKLNYTPFKLNEALLQIKTEFIHKGKELKLIPEIQIEGEPIPNNLIGDSQQTIAIINHLIENAAKFTRVKPSATLKLKVLKKTQEDIFIQFSLSDNGIGIAPDQLENIFEPFKQIDDSSSREFDGTGMGLAICKQLVDLMEGGIWAESEVDKGSIFYFNLHYKPIDSNELFNLSTGT